MKARCPFCHPFNSISTLKASFFTVVDILTVQSCIKLKKNLFESVSVNSVTFSAVVLWLCIFRKPCPSASHQFDSDRPSLAGRVSIDQQTGSINTGENELVHRPSIKEERATCSIDQHHAYRQQISRLSSSGSAECPDSIFDYHSTHPSVDLDDVCFNSVDLDDIISIEDTNKDSCKNVGPVIHELEEGQEKTKSVVSSQSAEVTASSAIHVSKNCQSVAPLASSKSALPLGSSALPLASSSSRMQSRLPAPRSRTTAKVAPGSRQSGKPDQVINGLCQTRS